MGKQVSGWGACEVPPEATGLQNGIPVSQDPFPLPISTPVGPWTLPLEEKLGKVSRREPLPPSPSAQFRWLSTLHGAQMVLGCQGLCTLCFLGP